MRRNGSLRDRIQDELASAVCGIKKINNARAGPNRGNGVVPLSLYVARYILASKAVNYMATKSQHFKQSRTLRPY